MLFALLFLSQSTISADFNKYNCMVSINAIDDKIVQVYNHYYQNYGLKQTSILYVGGVGKNNYSKIQDAINDADDGDIIFVYGSYKPYYEHIVINSSITLIGENQQTTIIDGSQNGSVIQIQSDFVTIRGFTIQQSGYDFFYEWDSGIVCKGIESCEISDNIIKNNYIGIYVTLCNNILIKNNTIFSNNIASDGIICTYTYYINISNNVFGVGSNTQRDALYLSQVTNSLVSSSYIFNYQNGLRLFRSNLITIQKNLLLRNQMFGIQMQYCGENAIQNNTIRGSFFGIIINYVPPLTENFITGNDLIDNTNDAFFVELDSGKTKWYHNFWDEPRILPKAILGFSRDNTKIQDEIAIPVVTFDKMPNNKLNNGNNINFPLVSDKESLYGISQYYKTNILSTSMLFQSYMIPRKTTIDLKEAHSQNIKQSNASIRDQDMIIGDIIFMECKRYNPIYSRIYDYCDHVALYIGDDPITKEKMFVEAGDGFGPSICSLSEYEELAHHFALGRVIHATEKQRIGAVTWAKQLCLERNEPITNRGDRIFDNYQYFPADLDILGCWKRYLLDGFEKYSQFWYCSELVWAAYYVVDDQGNLDIFQKYSQRIDLDKNGWMFPFVVEPIEIFNNTAVVEIYYKDPLN